MLMNSVIQVVFYMKLSETKWVNGTVSSKSNAPTQKSTFLHYNYRKNIKLKMC